LRRARKLNREPHRELSRYPAEGLALAAGSADSIFVTFAAHEVRDRAGQLVITEHVARSRQTSPSTARGAMHFQPAATWRARAAEAGLSLESQTAITPFVCRIVCRR